MAVVAAARRSAPSTNLRRPVFVTTLDEHAIQRERRLPEQSQTMCNALLSNFDAAVVSGRERFEDRQLGLQQVRGTNLDSPDRTQLAGLG